MKALILGVSGQDGAYLSRFLLSKGYQVHGASRNAQENEFSNLGLLGVKDRVALHTLDPGSADAVSELIETVRPSEVYYLTGQSSVGDSFKRPVETFESMASPILVMLECLRSTTPRTRLFFAVSSECFGNTVEPATVTTPFRPQSPYGVAKASGFWMVSVFRKAYGLYACSGVLFNHESPLRPESFVVRKIVSQAVRIAKGEAENLSLGDISIRRDWGWAPEYVEAMWMMLRRDTPEDFIIATGQSFSLEEILAVTFDKLGLDWRDYVENEPGEKRPADIAQSLADVRATSRELSWTAKTGMHEVIEYLIDFEKSGTIT